MASLAILDSLSLPGHVQKPNEDRCGWTGTRVFVIDGATGLGEASLDSEEGSDAAWLAELARRRFGDADPHDTVHETVRAINRAAAKMVAGATAMGGIERWNLPVASFLLARIEQGRLVAYGLGDCVLFMTGPGVEPMRHSPMPDNHESEMAGARAAIRLTGRLKPGASLSDGGAERERQRTIRSRFNTAGGPLWTLGTAPEAAAHLDHAVIHDGGPAHGLVCTDGFAALVDLYQRYTAGGLVEAARTEGLAALGGQLRAIEHEEDPGGLRYPRMKRSDDATAVLFEIT